MNLRLVRSASLRQSKACTTASSTIVSQRRLASSDSHSHDEHHHSEGEHTHEGFSAPIWRNTAIISVVAFAAYRLAPHPDPHATVEEPFLTRYLSHWTTPSTVWKERNARHLELVVDMAETKLVAQNAQRPPMHRLRYAGSFDQASPHCTPVGSLTDLSGLVVRADDVAGASE
ncbi:hypothetical protein BOTBODRAFT_26110 [Botryobasidium botryosum FD-172 SS1]|uniref:Uncharacterized protein n=1 Tax=Botryobasidium botryosum (strain FD-172 SS1) TaxID=930990 RepID=A0A067N1E7_BOTB1|nr:hypothetical protein BOTBODRAFT_26110 [Botryobasidium botryosum FD-172 SS1]